MDLLVVFAVAFLFWMFVYWFIGGPYANLLKVLSGNNSQSFLGKLAGVCSKAQEVSLFNKVLVSMVLAAVAGLISLGA